MSHIKRINRGADKELVILSGWGFAPEILLVPDLPFNYIFWDRPMVKDPSDELHNYLKNKDISSFWLLGWSLGAFRALEIYEKLKGMIEGLFLVSVTRSFSVKLLCRLEKELDQDPCETMRGFYKRCFRGQMDDYLWFSKHLEQRCLKMWKTEDLKIALRYLRGRILSLEKIKAKTFVVIQGRQDVITPPKAMPILPKKLQPVIFDHAGHLPFLKREFSSIIEKAI